MAKVTRDLRQLSKEEGSPSLFRRNAEHSALSTYVDKLEHNCFLCNRIQDTFTRYVDTIFHLYKKDPALSEKIRGCKGFCTYHYAMLYEQAAAHLSKDTLNRFRSDLNEAYFSNMERMQEDIEWFINKFDYRYQKEPWKNSKDALPRAILKTHSTMTPDGADT
jgi:hypothetical protein